MSHSSFLIYMSKQNFICFFSTKESKIGNANVLLNFLKVHLQPNNGLTQFT